jgi:glycerol uptake facilitator-like aquaporin
MNIFVSELIGTFILVAAVLSTKNKYYIALAFLLAITVSNISKGHINPVITMVKYIQGAVTKQETVNYISGQVSGALVAYYIVTKVLNKN